MILRKEGENRRHGRRPYTKALRSGGGVRGWWRGEKPPAPDFGHQLLALWMQNGNSNSNFWLASSWNPKQQIA
jgi:hypothetical protein